MTTTTIKPGAVFGFIFRVIAIAVIGTWFVLWLLSDIKPFNDNDGELYAAWEDPGAREKLRTIISAEVQNEIESILTHGAKRITVTAYTASVNECNEDPENTAIMTRPIPGWTVAVSRDLLEEGWTFGKKIWIEGLGVREIGDLMNNRYEGRIDVLMAKKGNAKRFGLKRDVLVVKIGG